MQVVLHEGLVGVAFTGQQLLQDFVSFLLQCAVHTLGREAGRQGMNRDREKEKRGQEVVLTSRSGEMVSSSCCRDAAGRCGTRACTRSSSRCLEVGRRWEEREEREKWGGDGRRGRRGEEMGGEGRREEESG